MNISKNKKKSPTLNFMPAMLAVDSYKESDLEKEQVANMTHLWKTGIFKTGIYEGQDLVTAQMDCEGPCPAAIFRFAYDEKSKNSHFFQNILQRM